MKAPIRVFIIPDVHWPFHSRVAWRTTLQALEFYKPDRTVFLGDGPDCLEISDFTKDPSRKTNFKREMKIANAELDKVDTIVQNEKFYILGNHEDRLSRLIAKRAPELHGFVSIEQILKLGERGYHVTPYGDELIMGKLRLSHDYGQTGRYCALKAREAVGHNIVFGHSHRAQCDYGGLVTGERHVAWSMGWLGDHEQLAFSYKKKWAAKRDWTHGFGTALIEPGGNVHVHFHPIVSGRVELGGKIIGGRE